MDLELRRGPDRDRRARTSSTIRRTRKPRTFLIAALPVSLRYDGSNDLLDPTKGFRLGGRISPEISAQGGNSPTAESRSTRAPIIRCPSSVVVAGRVRLGTIIGASRSIHRSVATLLFRRRRIGSRIWLSGARTARRVRRPDRRSRPGRVRARGTRSAQSLRRQFRDRPVPRWRHFVVRRDRPDFSKWQFGAGIGVRYYSSFGPIRVDVGTPLNPRSGDAPVAVVVSLGQAF